MKGVFLTAGPRGFPVRRAAHERDIRAAAGEDAVMCAEIPDELEMRREAALLQHTEGVAADREDAALFDHVMIVECEAVLGVADAALVDHRLAVILA